MNNNTKALVLALLLALPVCAATVAQRRDQTLSIVEQSTVGNKDALKAIIAKARTNAALDAAILQARYAGVVGLITLAEQRGIVTRFKAGGPLESEAVLRDFLNGGFTLQ